MYKWHKFSKSMVGDSCPKNLDAIYICHSYGVHYDIVLDVLSETKLAPLYVEQNPSVQAQFSSFDDDSIMEMILTVEAIVYFNTRNNVVAMPKKIKLTY